VLDGPQKRARKVPESLQAARASLASQTVPRVVVQSERRHLGGAQNGQRLFMLPARTALSGATPQVVDDEGEQGQEQGEDEDQDIEQDEDETGGSEPSPDCGLPASPPTLLVAKEPGQPNDKKMRKPRVVWRTKDVERLTALLQDPACPRNLGDRRRNQWLADQLGSPFETSVVMNKMSNLRKLVRKREAAENGAPAGTSC
jgi:hypothetical protein